MYTHFVAWRKVKHRIWKLPNTAHNMIIHNIAYNMHIVLEKRLIKFIHSALNSNEMCEQILCVQLRCKNASFAENYGYLSWKYNFSDCDWITNIAYLMGKVNIKQLLLYPVSHDASVLHDLLVCGIGDNDFCGIFTTTRLKQSIIDISIN